MDNINEIAHRAANGATLEQLREKAEKREQRLKENAFGRIVTRTPDQEMEYKAKEREYWDRTFGTNKKMRSFGLPELKQEMAYEEARAQVKKMIVERAYEIAVQKGLPQYRFEFTVQQGEVIAELIRWCINAPCSIDLAKGIYLYGNPGIGKTEIMRILSEFTQKNRLSKAFTFTNLAHKYDRAVCDDRIDLIGSMSQFPRCLDEFALKKSPIFRYGNKIDANDGIIMERYMRFKKYRQVTILVSNYDTNHTKDILSEMAFDRMKEMVKSVHFPGEKSHRG